MSSGNNTNHSLLPPPVLPVRRPGQSLPRPGTAQPPVRLDLVAAEQQQRQQQQEWREREHRQRTIRLLMMFLMMLLLMDEDNNSNNNTNQNKNYDNSKYIRAPNDETYRLRGSSSRNTYSGVSTLNNNKINAETYRRNLSLFLHHRTTQDNILQNTTQHHERYQRLVHDKNHDRDYIQLIHEWCQKQMDIVKDEFFTTALGSDTTAISSSHQIHTNEENIDGILHDDSSSSGTSSTNHDGSPHWLDDKTIAYHYPWNTTGFYRGSWKRIIPTSEQQQASENKNVSNTNINNNITANMIQLLSSIAQSDRILFERRPLTRNSTRNLMVRYSNTIVTGYDWVNAIQIQEQMIQRLRYRHQVAAIVPLPFGVRLRRYDDDDDQNSTSRRGSIYRSTHSGDIELVRNQGSGENYKVRDGRKLLDMTTITTRDTLDHADSENNSRQSQHQHRIAGMNEYSSKDILALLMSPAQQQQQQSNEQRPSEVQQQLPLAAITLTRDDGRAAFQLFGRRIAGMKELSYVSGFLKLYDSTAAGYSTRKDVLLRVHGVLLHSIGRLSLVANMDEDSIALVIDPSYGLNSDDNINAHRRLQEAVRSLVAQKTRTGQSVDEETLSNIRDEAIALHGRDEDAKKSSNHNEKHGADSFWILDSKNAANDDDSPSSGSIQNAATKIAPPIAINEVKLGDYSTDAWSDVVIPHPFIHDDTHGYSALNSHVTSPTPKMIPLQEQALEKNAAGCTFEITMDVSEVEYTIGAWKRLLLRRYTELQIMDPSNQPGGDVGGLGNSGNQRISATNSNDYANRHVRPYISSWPSSHISREYPKEAMVMNMVGEIHSYTCNFHAQINTTALRTDWDATTSKAINYSFYMMLVCLIQIFILLRQLLHSQSPSVATRVSLICIGWQTIIDALLCLIHIYLSLAVQPLFTAFASVAFFKLLIFCVIEMKYMAIIVQARHNSGGATITADELRHQVAVLHIRFYVAMVIIFLFVFYSPGKNRTYIILALYSFWVPQIILNIITEAKAPLHKHYIYGMSVTRVIAPLYIFGLRNNFLKEVYPESTTDSLLCQLLVLWVGCQTAILIAQGKYGARFMIPKRFLPPKFDYSRPIPASMLPPGALLDLPSPESMEDRDNDGLQGKGSTKREDGDSLTTNTHPDNSRELDRRSVPLRHQTADTTRNRHNRGGRLANTVNPASHQRGRNNTRAMVKEDITVLPKAKPTPAPVLECSICYENIDVRDRFKYMLAPCNHLYHSECLKQWMEVKMECPICRTVLPPL
jgi:Ring finger domain